MLLTEQFSPSPERKSAMWSRPMMNILMQSGFLQRKVKV